MRSPHVAQIKRNAALKPVLSCMSGSACRNRFSKQSAPARKRRVGLAAVFATLMLCGPLVTTAGADSHARQGYIDATALNVRADAGVRSDIVGILLKYDEVSITGERKVGSTTWYSIEASGGYNSGWVSARFVELGAPPEVPAPAEVDYGAKETPTLLPGSFQYVGAKRCQECHDEAIGDYPNGAYGVWKGHFHSNAYATLAAGGGRGTSICAAECTGRRPAARWVRGLALR